MSTMADLPCDADGMCMVCKIIPPDGDVLLCGSCCSPWHMRCLNPPLECVPLDDWSCPDCAPLSLSSTTPATAVKALPPSEDTLVGKIRAIQADDKLTDDEKAKRRQELMSKGLHDHFPVSNKTDAAHNKNRDAKNNDTDGKKQEQPRNETLELLDQSLNYIFCMQLPERPVTVSVLNLTSISISYVFVFLYFVIRAVFLFGVKEESLGCPLTGTKSLNW